MIRHLDCGTSVPKRRRVGTARDVDYQALAELRHQLRRFLTFSETQARAAGIEPQQHQVLLAIKGLPDGLRPTISVLAERLVLKHHTVVGLADRLVAAEFAVRVPNPSDRREILLQITARGERVLRTLSLAHQAELSHSGPTLVMALRRALLRSARREQTRRAQ
jgi:DNA-binding MarR family transcriptional regulator